MKSTKPTTFLQALFAVSTLIVMIIYGIIIRPSVFNQTALPLEIIFLLSATIVSAQLLYLGYKWSDIQESMIRKQVSALPAYYIIFLIGVIIGTWMVSGTIPMLVYLGIKSINAQFFYLIAFIAPIIFSTLTGTSYGSAATIGVVIMGVALTLEANVAVTAGAIIGGAYFGDKLSPLSDTTNLAAIASDIDVYEHVHSMLYTTGPAAIIAATIYTIVGFVDPITTSSGTDALIKPTLEALEQGFNFNIFLLLPPAIVLAGSIARKPSIPILVISSIVSGILAMVVQGFSLADVATSAVNGFNVSMLGDLQMPENVQVILNRGGLYSLIGPITISFMVFSYIGAIDIIEAMPTVIGKVLGVVKRRSTTILCTLFSSALVNSLTSNQYATSFIVANAFKSKFDELGIPRKVLSRSLEDTGTMIESMTPWSSTTVFMVATLGVSYAEYAPWQLLSLLNFIIAPTLAILGIGCFYNTTNTTNTNTK